MKHDKHKAKRSAKYKKKHGIVNSKSKRQSDEEKPKEVHDGKSTDVTGEPRLHASTQESRRIEDLAGGSTASTTSTTSSSTGVRTFAKRQIESNWTKYSDFPAEEEHVTCRGADFEALVNQSGGAASQFRLKEEHLWEDDTQPDQTETDISKLFKVDFVQIALRFQAIPLYERLGITDKYFEKDILKRIDQDAAKHAQTFQKLEIKETIPERTSYDVNTNASVNAVQNDMCKDVASPSAVSNYGVSSERLKETDDLITPSNSVKESVNIDCIDTLYVSGTQPDPTACDQGDSSVVSQGGGSVASANDTITEYAASDDTDSTAEPGTQANTCSDIPKAQEGVENLEDWLDEYLND